MFAVICKFPNMTDNDIYVAIQIKPENWVFSWSLITKHLSKPDFNMAEKYNKDGTIHFKMELDIFEVADYDRFVVLKHQNTIFGAIQYKLDIL